MERPQVNIRLQRDLLAELDDLAQAEQLDRAELARRLLRQGLSRERLDVAVRQYREGSVSAGRAAEVARVSLYEMLDRIHQEGIPYELDPQELARIGETSTRSARVAEARASYEAGPAADRASGIDQLREDFRPSQVRTLFVGESSPAGGTHFYRANSNLFRATHEAFEVAYGDTVPDGPRFLHWFRDQGCWLVDLADRPVNRLPGRPRKDAVDAGVDRLVDVIRATRPERIIVVKASIGRAVRRAGEAAGYGGDVAELPFPVRQWRSLFVRQLAALLRGAASAEDKVVRRPRRSRGQPRREP